MAGKRKSLTDKGGGVGSKGKKIKEPLRRCLRQRDDLLSSNYILKKVFRKDGPPLGVEFDSPSSCAFELREKVKKHGIGKGLMTVWKAINPDGGDFPGLFSLNNSEFNVGKQMSTSVCHKKNIHEKNSQKQKPARTKLGKGTSLKNKRKAPISRTKAQHNKTEKSKEPRKQKCGLSLEGLKCDYDQGQCPMLVEDEELELRELQARPNPLTCTAYFSTNGMHARLFPL